MGFDQTIQTQIAAESPVSSPSMAGGLAQVAGNFLGAFAPRPSTQTSGSGGSGDELNQALIRGLGQAQQLREQGDLAGATNLERTVRINFAAAGGNFSSGEVQDLVTAVTGRPSESLGFTTAEVAYQEVIGSDEFKQAYVGTYATDPDMTNEQRESRAVSLVSMGRANDAIIQETQFQWRDSEGQSSRISAVQDWTNSTFGLLAVAAQEGIAVTNDAVQQAIVEFGALKGAILATRPTDITAEQWKPVADSLNATRERLDFLLKLNSVGEVSADAQLNIMDAIGRLEGADPLDQNLAIFLLGEDPNILRELGIVTTADLLPIFDSARNLLNTPPTIVTPSVSGVTGATPTDAEGGTLSHGAWGQGVYDSASGLSPGGAFRDVQALSNVIRMNGGIVSDETRNNYLNLVGKATASLHSMASNNEGWLTATGYRQFFNKQYFEGLTALRDGGHRAEYDTVMMQSRKAVEANRTAILAGLSSVTRGDIVQYDRVTNSLVITRESLMNSSVVPPQILEHVFNIINEEYGGDFNAALADSLGSADGSLDIDSYNRGAEYKMVNQVFKYITSELRDSHALDRINGLKQLTEIEAQLVPMPQGELPSIPTNILLNPGMNPLISSMEGASGMTKGYAANRMAEVLAGPFTRMQNAFGAQIMINDAIAKAGTDREVNRKNSRHFHGDALDIPLAGMSNEDRIRLVRAAIEAGFQGFGLGDGILHIDMGYPRHWAYNNATFGGRPISEVYAFVSGGTLPPESFTTITDGSGRPGGPSQRPEPEDDPIWGPATNIQYGPSAPAEWSLPEGEAVGDGITTSALPPLGDVKEGEAASAQAASETVERAREEASSVVTQRELSEEELELVSKGGFEIQGGKVPSFENKDSLLDALTRGDVKSGDIIWMDGVLIQLGGRALR